MGKKLHDGSQSARSCCTPLRPASGAMSSTQAVRTRASTATQDGGAVSIPGGAALVGTRKPGIPDDGESPMRKARVAPFRIGATSVSNAEFRAFVDATQYVTEAERIGWSFVFWAQVPHPLKPTSGVVGAEWWRQVKEANWRDINGPGTEAAACHSDHPVVHVSWNDARAYCDWVGGALPSEAEWEHAARGGLGDVKFPWGDDDPDDDAFFPCNIWQGKFPDDNTAMDGFATTAPVHAYAANGYGLYNMVGNVWEWSEDAFRIKSLKRSVRARLEGMRGFRLSKGGSFLCHRSYCYRYRIAARSGTSPDSTTSHHGFRVIWRD